MTKIYISEELRSVLTHNDINPDTGYTPAYGGESAGLDLFNCSDDVIVKPQTGEYNSERTLISTGLRLFVPLGYVALIQERGSITKTPLKVRAGVIDSGYTGEVFVNCINTSSQEYTIEKNSKLPFQIVIVKCDNQFDVISQEEYINLSQSSRRGDGKIGSSD
jgi:dUTP pyrophosphatase